MFVKIVASLVNFEFFWQLEKLLNVLWLGSLNCKHYADVKLEN
jgi:hypothetical protein